jgi:hypothetical protein
MNVLIRAMREDEDGCPECGPTARTLGVRLEGDLPITEDGMVEPETGGMSVALNDPHNLPRHRLPKSLGGRGIDPAWQIDDSDLPDSLTLRPDPRKPSRHGFVEPIEVMPLQAYQEALASSRGNWTQA